MTPDVIPFIQASGDIGCSVGGDVGVLPDGVESGQFKTIVKVLENVQISYV